MVLIITFSSHLKYLTGQGFIELLNVMNLIMHPSNKFLVRRLARTSSKECNMHLHVNAHLQEACMSEPLTSSQWWKLVLCS